jgi:UDP-2,4-diacetamido-2,4,6-trideoxy-beta-L-altropyranose hydrolase
LRFLFRVDGSRTIGSGHIVRCAALASVLKRDGNDTCFICRNAAGGLGEWLQAQGFSVRSCVVPGGWSQIQDAELTLAALEGESFDWIVVDHYELGLEWEHAMTPAGARILAIDDIGRPHECDILLDQNYPNSIHAKYKNNVPDHCTRLLGPAFSLVRSAFGSLRTRSLARPRDRISSILVFMGGGDLRNETSKAVEGIGNACVPSLTINVVVGNSNPHVGIVASLVDRMRNARLHVQTSQMAELMASADIAICAGGTTTWERCVLGLPAFTTILADNQVPIVHAMAASGVDQPLGWHHELSADDYARALATFDIRLLPEMSTRASKICDGRGAERVSRQLTRWPLNADTEIDLRHA